jgi:phosphonate transport system substrate-binding protein
VSQDSAVQRVEDLKPGLRVAQTQDPDVNLMGMIMLEPADIGPSHVQAVPAASYVLVAKHLVLNRADVGFFLKRAFDDLSVPTRAKLRPLVTSQISVVRHVLLSGPRMQEHLPVLREALLDMHHPGNEGRRVLEALCLAGWEGQDVEDTEFMIDLMDALTR